MTEFTTGNLDPDAFTTPEEQAALAASGEQPHRAHRATIDPDLSALADGPAERPEEVLDDVRADLNSQTVRRELIAVTGRERYAVEFMCNVTSRELEKLRTQSRDGSFKETKVDPSKYNALLVATKAVAIYRDGQPLELDGKVATFMEPSFIDLMQRDGEPTIKAVTAVIRFYGGDGYVQALANKLLELSGFGEEVEVLEDPTR